MNRPDASPRPLWAGARGRGPAPAGARKSSCRLVTTGSVALNHRATEAQRNALRRLTTDEHRCAHMNTDGVATAIRRAYPSAFILSDPCSSVSPFLPCATSELKGNTRTQVQIPWSPPLSRRRKPGPINTGIWNIDPGFRSDFRRGDDVKPGPRGLPHSAAGRRSPGQQLCATSAPLWLCGSWLTVSIYPRMALWPTP
jgi:hypothetical protein